MIRLFLSIYYSLALFVLISDGWGFLNKSISEKAWAVLNDDIFSKSYRLADVFLSVPYKDFSYAFVFSLTCLALFACAARPKKIYRAAGALLFNLSFLMLLYQGPADPNAPLYFAGTREHDYYIWMISSLILCFPDEKKRITAKDQLFFIRLCQAFCLLHYFISGLWKARMIWANGLPEKPHSIMMDQLAVSVLALHVSIKPLFLRFFMDVPWLMTAGWALAIAFQLSCAIPILREKHYLEWGIASVVFHLAAMAVMGVYFTLTALAVLFFLLITEKLIALEGRPPDRPD